MANVFIASIWQRITISRGIQYPEAQTAEHAFTSPMRRVGAPRQAVGEADGVN